ncbi:hypothetical protein HDV05_001843 [Chytridiales sp. JEL 0842]|nr:hypothetical protein HDV05_001843 [Chytridiales sp. JEL 0842]
MKHITQPNIFEFKVADILPEQWKADISYYSPLFKNKSISDVAFQIEDKIIYAMSGILMHFSPYFKAFLSTPFQESKFNKSSPITLSQVSYFGVEKCFEWMYNGCILSIDEKKDPKDFDISDAIAIYETADLFLMQDLLDILPTYMETKIDITAENYGTLFIFAHKRELNGLLKKAIQAWLDDVRELESAGVLTKSNDLTLNEEEDGAEKSDVEAEKSDVEASECGKLAENVGRSSTEAAESEKDEKEDEELDEDEGEDSDAEGYDPRKGYGRTKFLPLSGGVRDETITLKFDMSKEGSILSVNSTNVINQFISLFNSIKSYRLQRNYPLVNNESVSDVAFQVEDKTIYAISAILAHYSAYFNALLLSHYKEASFTKKFPITLSQVSPYGVLKCFQWIYCGCIINGDVNDNQLPDFDIEGAIQIYEAADMFLLDDLLNIFTSYMSICIPITPETFGVAFVFAHKRDLNDLLQKSIRIWFEQLKKIEEAGERDKVSKESSATSTRIISTRSTVAKKKKEEVEDAPSEPMKQAAMIREYMSTLPMDSYNKLMRVLAQRDSY